MTIRQALQALDERKCNTVSQEKKLAWLSRLDQMVQALLAEHFSQAPTAVPTYGPDTGLDTQLLISAPYDGIYSHYLAAPVVAAKAGRCAPRQSFWRCVMPASAFLLSGAAIRS